MRDPWLQPLFGAHPNPLGESAAESAFVRATEAVARPLHREHLPTRGGRRT
ncbi:MAG: hypothetical protein U5K33_08370 [Halofilum sp. (in: g-proteobacteria)]|nr:hypothetical protein [Halofilum sp. (in: g-proteobacteria)]